MHCVEEVCFDVRDAFGGCAAGMVAVDIKIVSSVIPRTVRASRRWKNRSTFRSLPHFQDFKATPHNYVCGALRKFCPLILLRFLAIHQVLLQKRAASGGKISS